LLAYQIAFELSDGAPVVLMNSIIEKLPGMYLAAVVFHAQKT